MDNNSNQEMNCPHCHAKLSNKEAITMLNGSGYVRIVLVRTPDGKIHAVNAGLDNPNAVDVLDD